MRGSPHEHTFLWLKNAPLYEASNPTSIESCVDFIDKFITCQYDPKNPLITLRKHRHSNTCRKGKRNKEKRRFNFPFPVMPRTMILDPITEDVKTDELKEEFKKVRTLMNNLYKKEQSISFEYVLRELEMTEEEYIISYNAP